jgi:hypothetical protein
MSKRKSCKDELCVVQEKVRFQREYPEVCEIVEDIHQELFYEGMSSCLLYAPTKSGKRKIKEFFSLLTSEFCECCGNQNSHILNVYLSAFYMKEEFPQYEEMEKYGISVYKKKEYASELLQDVQEHLSKSKNNSVIVHINECDYGSAKTQVIANVVRTLEATSRVKTIYYSATPEEPIHSVFCDKDTVCVKEFKPNKNYRGSEYFLRNNLVTQSEPFFLNDKIELSDQGQKCVTDHLKNNKFIGICRVSSSRMQDMRNNYNLYHEELKQYGCKPILISSHDDINVISLFNWDKDRKDNMVGWHSYYDQYRLEELDLKPVFFVVNMFSRSTECGFHEYIGFYHDHGDTTLCAALQRIGRMSHYHKFGHDIHLYVNPEVLKYDARWGEDYSGNWRENSKKFIDNMILQGKKPWSISSRIKTETKGTWDHIEQYWDFDSELIGQQNMRVNEWYDFVYHNTEYIENIVELLKFHKVLPKEIDMLTLREFKNIHSFHDLSKYTNKKDLAVTIATIAMGGIKKASKNDYCSTFIMPDRELMRKQLDKASSTEETDAWLAAINIMDSMPEHYGGVVLAIRIGEQIKQCLKAETAPSSNYQNL